MSPSLLRKLQVAACAATPIAFAAAMASSPIGLAPTATPSRPAPSAPVGGA